MRIVARAPGKLVVLGEYAVLDGAPALVLAIDRYAVATLEPSGADECVLETLSPDPIERRFARGAPSGAALVDLAIGDARALPAWRGSLDSTQLYGSAGKLGLGSSAAALCAWAGAWAAYARAGGVDVPAPALDGLIALHRGFQGGRGSGIDVAASLAGGVIEFRLDPLGVPRIGSVRLPNSVGFAGIFAGRPASTPELIAHYRAWKAARPAEAAAMFRRLSAAAEAGCAAARGEAADAFVEAIAAYGRGLQDLGVAIGADIVTAEHRQIGEHARRHGVAYKVSGAGGGDLGFACALDRDALAGFETAVREHGFRVLKLGLAGRGLTVNELADERVGGRWE